jgi:hypothetical protein
VIETTFCRNRTALAWLSPAAKVSAGKVKYLPSSSFY